MPIKLSPSTQALVDKAKGSSSFGISRTPEVQGQIDRANAAANLVGGVPFSGANEAEMQRIRAARSAFANNRDAIRAAQTQSAINAILNPGDRPFTRSNRGFSTPKSSNTQFVTRPGRSSPVGRNPLIERLMSEIAERNRQRSMTPGPSHSLPNDQFNPLAAPTPTTREQAELAITRPGELETPSRAGTFAGASSTTSPGLTSSRVSTSPVQASNPDALTLLTNLINQGGSQAARQSSANQQQAQSDLLSTLQALNPLAQGQAFSTPILQGIARDIKNTLFRDINRASEAGGSSQNALAQYLRNQGLAQIESAQANAALQAQLSAAQNQSQLGNTLNTIGTQDPLTDELLALLQAGARLPVLDDRTSFDLGFSFS